VRLNDVLWDEVALLRQALTAIETNIQRPLPLAVLAALTTRITDFRQDLVAEFPRLATRSEAR
jgi:hypothetical protein